ncbi:type II CRISPR-associated endonuclease Cas1 [Mesoplasma corruscae]|uniref:CRISPR-associated endonuclease Cas1 n=1 Tax=Mesoplasma corruscae TaxID=216874 RepID=A0A2S5RED9_9MOLU|nr:type II CRISPR-associated endonuclease Cas1 [Mesoplasma corruscae]PPE05667.1 CRISPR-associated protein Cas1 [Mesoplasma corruscae]
MSWKTLIIRDSDKLSLFLDNIVISQKGISTKFLISDINSIIIEDYKTLLTTKIISKLVENNVMIIICNESNEPSVLMQSIKGHYIQQKRIRDQINWNYLDKRVLWTLIVKQKIENQIDILKINRKNQSKIIKLYEYIQQIQEGDLTNREGHAAKVYFNELFGRDFNREQNSLINSALNYGYTILRAAFSRSIVAKGLHPSISLFHSNRYDYFALSDDLMEPFRPIIDDYVYNNHIKWDYFGKNQKMELINILNSQVLFDNKMLYVHNAINVYIEKIINYMETLNVDEIVFPLITTQPIYYEL